MIRYFYYYISKIDRFQYIFFYSTLFRLTLLCGHIYLPGRAINKVGTKSLLAVTDDTFL